MKLRQRSVRGGLAALACFSAPVLAGLLTDGDTDWKEGNYELPAAPRSATLRPFSVISVPGNRFFIDEATLSVGDDGVVRYVMVVRAAGGAENVTFEGIRCAAGSWRLYATGRADGGWATARDAAWRPIADAPYSKPRAALAQDYFCDESAPVQDRDDAVRRLRGNLGRLPVSQ